MKKFSHIRKVYEQDEILTNIANVETAAQISPVVDEVPTEAQMKSVVTFSLNCLNQEKWHTFIIYK
jgi:hypothetical protein